MFGCQKENSSSGDDAHDPAEKFRKGSRMREEAKEEYDERMLRECEQLLLQECCKKET